MKMTTAYAITWLSTAIAVSVAIYVTKHATPLWAMLIPTFISFSNGSNENEGEVKSKL